MDQARRKIHWYYKSAYQLYAGGLIDKKVLEIITGTNGYDLFCNVVIRMSRDIRTGNDTERRFEWFDKMVAEFPSANL